MRIGVDLGGSKIEIIALDSAGDILIRRRCPTPAGDYAATLAAIAHLVDGVEAELGQRGTVGIGTPGSLSPTRGVIRNANSVCLNGRSLQHDLQRILGRPVRLANDANCFALSEATDGAGAGAHILLGVILGTGTGGGIVVNGKLLQGSNAIAGEWGHNALPWADDQAFPSPHCYCGKRGCIETYLSGPGLSHDFQRHSGRQLTADAICALAEKGDNSAEAALARYQKRLARALAMVINILDPEVIVLGGGLSNQQRLYSEVPRLWGDYVFSDDVSTVLRPPLHGDSSGVRGAAWLWALEG